MSFHFQCLSLNVNLHVHCIGGPTQIHLLSPSVRVLILRNLDVLGLVVDLLQVDLLDDPGRLYFDSFDDVFVHGVRQLSLDLRFREPVPIPCKNPSQHYDCSRFSIPDRCKHVCLDASLCPVVCCRWSSSRRSRRATHGLPP